MTNEAIRLLHLGLQVIREQRLSIFTSPSERMLTNGVRPAAGWQANSHDLINTYACKGFTQSNLYRICVFTCDTSRLLVLRFFLIKKGYHRDLRISSVVKRIHLAHVNTNLNLNTF